jgi:DNA-binding GntR family transcriptional regulator
MSESVLQRIERPSLRDQVHARLRDAIVAGDLAPGARLRDADLAAAMGVSRTPVREALQRLEDEGLVQTFPGAMTRVAPLDVRDAREAVPVIAALHALAAREAVPRLTTGDLDVLREANAAFAAALAAGEVSAALAADDAFHDRFVRLAMNEELQRTLQRLMPRVRRLEIARFRSLPGRDSARQHEAILAAAGLGDARRAAMLVEGNWLGLGKLLAQSFVTDPEETTPHDQHDHSRE